MIILFQSNKRGFVSNRELLPVLYQICGPAEETAGMRIFQTEIRVQANNEIEGIASKRSLICNRHVN